ncbi:MAG: patatin-like phospholipase family protein [Deltaproteobacteria bacterium]|nr:patatin-like phospholipase family protein [Deltaproteobacteria bacterium]
MKLGIALGGGGARGLAHIGVLNVLHSAGIEFDIVVGTSVGALVGAVYAGGALAELEHEARNVRLTDLPLLLSPSWSLSGLFSGKNAIDLLSSVIPYNDIEELPRRFAAVAVDLHEGRSVVIDKGNITQAIRASIAIPGIFTPVVKDDMLLVDGGLLDPVPVCVARELGADYVLAIDLFGSLKKPSRDECPSEQSAPPPSLRGAGMKHLRTLLGKLPFVTPEESNSRLTAIGVLEQSLSINQRHMTALRLRESPPDDTICPPVDDVGFLDFHRGERVIEIGTRFGEECLDHIRGRIEEARLAQDARAGDQPKE